MIPTYSGKIIPYRKFCEGAKALGGLGSDLYARMKCSDVPARL